MSSLPCGKPQAEAAALPSEGALYTPKLTLQRLPLRKLKVPMKVPRFPLVVSRGIFPSTLTYAEFAT